MKTSTEREKDHPVFGVLLRDLRLKAGLTQEELADRAQLSERAIRSLEHSRDRKPRLQTVKLIAHGLGLDDESTARLLLAARPVATTRSHETPGAALPQFLTSIVGRTEDVGLLTMLLQDRRLVTLTGTGGVGKTRVALMVAEHVAKHFDTVSFVELAPLRDFRQVSVAVAGSLAVKEGPSQPLFQRIVDNLTSKRVLLILDNMEHLLPAGEFVASLLRSCPDLSIFVTSREMLRLRGERVYTLGPLSLPEREADIERSPAVRLFFDRAADAGVILPRDHSARATVAEICRRLDGLPLAIELAAAWTPVLSLRELLDRLSSRLLLLRHGATDLPERQRTVRATIDWSYNRLSTDEQTLLARLSVFAGGFTLEAADSVCQGVSRLHLDTLDGLRSLLDKSLLTPSDAGSPRATRQTRFGMLETVREFAYEQLQGGSEATAAQREHVRYFLALAQQAPPRLGGTEELAWVAQMEQDHDNLRGALLTARGMDDAELGLKLAGALWPFWVARNHFEEAQQWLDEFLPRFEASEVAASTAARAFFAGGMLAKMQGNHESTLPLLRRSLSLAKESVDDATTAAALHALAGLESNLGNYRAAELLVEESRRIYERLEDQRGLCMVAIMAAADARYQGDYAQATSLYSEALAISRETEDLRTVADLLARLGNMATEMGMPADSPPLYEQALALYRDLEDDFGIADVLLRSGETAVYAGDYVRATQYCSECLELSTWAGMKYRPAYVLLTEGEAAIGMGDLVRAKAIAAESRALFEEIGDRRCVGSALMLLGNVEREQRKYSQAQELYRESLSLHLQLNTRPETARCLERAARLMSAQELDGVVAQLHGAAMALREAMDSAIAPAEKDAYEQCIASARVRMGDTAFDAHVAEGRAMSLQQVVNDALGVVPRRIR
jgi:predicted ATPase/DNA-binding XRE family transcriptional regulator